MRIPVDENQQILRADLILCQGNTPSSRDLLSQNLEIAVLARGVGFMVFFFAAVLEWLGNRFWKRVIFCDRRTSALAPAQF